MPKPWTGEIVGIMHNNDITTQDLANELGVRQAYISMILNSKREPPGIEERVKTAVERIIKRRNGDG